MKDLLSGILMLIVLGFLIYSLMNWLMLPSHVDKIAQELREIKEEIKDKK